MKSRNNHNAALGLAMIGGFGLFPEDTRPRIDTGYKNSSKIVFSEEEIKELSTLSKKERKIRIIELRKKYLARANTN